MTEKSLGKELQILRYFGPQWWPEADLDYSTTSACGTSGMFILNLGAGLAPHRERVRMPARERSVE